VPIGTSWDKDATLSGAITKIAHRNRQDCASWSASSSKSAAAPMVPGGAQSSPHRLQGQECHGLLVFSRFFGLVNRSFISDP
jgi:hypothetical protein